jgi:SAM-dependent methyltransferase
MSMGMGMKASAIQARHRLNVLARTYPLVPLRRAMTEGRARWIGILPARLRQRLDLDGGPVVPLRIEIGCGPLPTAGYVHVDANRSSRHLEYVAPAWRLPFPDRSVHELLAVHILEHVHPTWIERTLREWQRVLAPGGFAEIHVPDASTVFPAYLEAAPEDKWKLLVPIFGTTGDPTQTGQGAGDLERHHVVYDFDMLRQVLIDSGFDHVDDMSEKITDYHDQAWKDAELVDRISLIVHAFAHPNT